MASTSRDKSVYLTAVDARTRKSRTITVKGHTRDRLIRFLTLAVDFGLDEVERATWKRPKGQIDAA